MTKPPFQLAVDNKILIELIHKANNKKNFYNESLVRRLVKQITIWEDCITVELKSSVSIALKE